MYQAFFGLRDSPFGLTPDPKYLFPTDAHKEALASVMYGLQERKGFVLILGEVGTGKTSVVRHILSRLGSGTKAAFVFNAAIGFDELLRVVLRELEVPCQSRSRGDMVETLHRFLLDEAVAGRVVALIIDEAQHLSSAVLEELRMLSNLETTRSKLLQIILVGQPELGATLARPGLRQVRQRIGLVAELRPLTRHETVQYINHRLEIAGGDGREIFTWAALRRIHRASGGIPRLINVVCDKALILAYGAERRRVTRGIVETALKDWEVFSRRSAPQRLAPPRRAAGAWRVRRSRTARFPRIAAAVLLPLVGAAALLLAASHTPSLWTGFRHGTPSTAAPGPVPTPMEGAAASPPSFTVSPVSPVSSEATPPMLLALPEPVPTKRPPGPGAVARSAPPELMDLPNLTEVPASVVPESILPPPSPPTAPLRSPGAKVQGFGVASR